MGRDAWAAIAGVLLCSLARTGAVIGLWGCPDQKVVENFEIDDYEGVWYEYSKYARASQNERFCPQEEYTSSTNRLVNFVYQYKKDNVIVKERGQMKPAVPTSSDGQYSFSFIEGAYINRENENTKVNYQILDTDYTGYSIVWDCQSVFFLHFTKLRILTRERSPQQSMVDEIYRELGSRGIKTSLLHRNNHDDC